MKSPIDSSWRLAGAKESGQSGLCEDGAELAEESVRRIRHANEMVWVVDKPISGCRSILGGCQDLIR